MLRCSPACAGAVLLGLIGCGSVKHLQDTSDLSETRQRFDALRSDLRRELFERNRIAGPNLSLAPQTTTGRGLKITVRPSSAESQVWNSWPDGTARLFNDAVGYLWVVELDTAAPATWLPSASQLAVNDTEQVFKPAAGPDDALMHLLTAARLETALGSSGDLDLRVRAADPFRQAYLASTPIVGHHEAVILFPAPARTIHAIAMELRLSFDTAEGVQHFDWLFE